MAKLISRKIWITAYFCNFRTVKILTKKLSWQWAQTTLHIPGTLGTGFWGGPDGARLITLLQFCLGHAILTLVFLQIKRQLQGHLTYFRPGGAFRIGVASPHDVHLTTCCSLFPEISIKAWKKQMEKFEENAPSIRHFSSNDFWSQSLEIKKYQYFR